MVYFGRLLSEFTDYTSELGFLDHELHRRLFWFTTPTLFFPGSPDGYKLGLLVVGLLASLMLVVGWKPKIGAAVAWIVAVSVHRWNFAVINVDDSSITLALWWMLFFPIGNCFTYRTWRESSWRKEVNLTVDGFFIRAFFLNLFIYYLTAGLTKLWSPLWKEGLALFVILKLPLARSHDWWELKDLPFLWMGNHFTLLMEPLFPFLLLLPKSHPVKWLGGVAWLTFHLSIPLTIGVPYANFVLILALVLVFHRELADALRRKAHCTEPLILIAWTPPWGSKGLIKVYLTVLFLAMLKGLPYVGGVYEPAMATLYWGGVAQEYHLFDWIDRYNWSVAHEVTVTPNGGRSLKVSSAGLFPPTVRGFIVQSYLLPMRWMRVPRPLTGEMRNSILLRAAERFLRNNREVLGDSGLVRVETDVARVTRDNLDLSKSWRVTLMEFRYNAEGVEVFMNPVMPIGTGEGRRE